MAIKYNINFFRKALIRGGNVSTNLIVLNNQWALSSFLKNNFLYINYNCLFPTILYRYKIPS